MNVNQCCVFNCVATDKSTLFKAPPELFEKWKEALKGKTRTGFYTENDSVCDKHFVVGKVDRALGKDQFGNVICYVRITLLKHIMQKLLLMIQNIIFICRP